MGINEVHITIDKSIREGKPFMFDERQCKIVQTIRRDRTILYRAIQSSAEYEVTEAKEGY